MTLPLNISVFFSGGDLTYSAEDLPAGLTMDGGTGLITGFPTDAGVSTVSLTAQNEAGAVTSTFTWTIEVAEAQTSPANTSSPFIVGAAEIGSVLTADPGAWTGEPAPTFSYQWRRDEVDIPGAVEIDYSLAAEDDLADVSVTVTGENDVGAAEATTASRAVTHSAPEAAGALPDLTLTTGSGPRIVDASEDFSGATGGAWSVSGRDATIDQNGVVTISTDAAAGQAEIVARYQNSGGEAASAFSITLEEAAAGGPVAITSGSVRFPASNATADAADIGYFKMPSPFPDGDNFAGGAGAFFAHVEIPVETYGLRDIKQRMVILGDGAGNTSQPGTMSLTARPIINSFSANLDERQARLTFNWNSGGTTADVDLLLGDHRRVLFVVRGSGATTLVELYAGGALIESVDTGELLSGLRSDIAIGADYDFRDDIAGTDGQTRGFNGAVGMVGYTGAAVSQAMCEALSAGSPYTDEVAEADWNMLRVFTGTDAASLASRASGDVLAAGTVVGSGFRINSDIAPARSGSAWLAADYVPIGRVWPAKPNAAEGRIKLSGVSGGLTGGVEARYYDQDGTLKKDWTALTGADLSAGAWTGTMMAPLGSGWGYIDVRAELNPGIVHRTRTDCGVGYLGSILSQSTLQFPLDLRDLGTEPQLGGAVSIARHIISGAATSGSGTVGLQSVEPGRRSSDGMAAMADAFKRFTDVPICIVDMTRNGTGIRQLVDDSRPERSWAELVAIAEMAGATDDDGFGLAGLYVNWYASEFAFGANYAVDILQPMIEGTAPPNADHNVDHFFRDGSFPDTLRFSLGAGARYQNDGTIYHSVPPGQPASGGLGELAAFATIDYAISGGHLIGSNVNDIVFADGGGHTAPGEPLGGQRFLERIAPSLLRTFGLDDSTDPSITSVEIDQTNTARLIVTVDLPNGGVLETAWDKFPETPPAEYPTVTGFEISIDGGQSQWNGRDGGDVTFTAEIVDAANGIIHIERTDAAAWPTDTEWNFCDPATLVYGLDSEDLRLVHGLPSESGRNVSQGVGLLVYGPAEGVATAEGGVSAPPGGPPSVVNETVTEALAENTGFVSGTYTAESGSNRIVIIGAAYDNAGPGYTSEMDQLTLSWDGVDIPPVVTSNIPGGRAEGVAIFAIREADLPAGGTGLVEVRILDDTATEMTVRSIAFQAFTVQDAGAADFVTGFSESQSLDVTPTADDSLVIAYSLNSVRWFINYLAPIEQFSEVEMPSDDVRTGTEFGKVVQDAETLTIQTNNDFGRHYTAAMVIEPG